ncbi:MAG TPA: hypothetical protein VJ819_06475 [Nocardioidaceae bacterium]|nr:hypothetical protein [Nocardioidaceae bacterium]
MFPSRFMPCPDCGESLERSTAALHRCAKDRELDYQMFRLRNEVDAFEERLDAYLSSSTGRFEVWLAARRVREAH